MNTVRLMSKYTFNFKLCTSLYIKIKEFIKLTGSWARSRGNVICVHFVLQSIDCYERPYLAFFGVTKCVGKNFLFREYLYTHRLNMEVDLQSLFGIHVTWCSQLYSLAEAPCGPQLPPSPCIWTRNTRALLVSKDRRHLFVTPWLYL